MTMRDYLCLVIGALIGMLFLYGLGIWAMFQLAQEGGLPI